MNDVDGMFSYSFPEKFLPLSTTDVLVDLSDVRFIKG